METLAVTVNGIGSASRAVRTLLSEGVVNMASENENSCGLDALVPCDEGIAEGKERLRRELKALRGALSPEQRAAADTVICNRVCDSAEFQDARVVFAYLAFGDEVETRGIIERAWEAGKVVALPRCVGPHEMRWFAVTDFEGLETSPYGVDEPPLDDAAEITPGADGPELAIVPALSFDPDGYRLGYGGGFYDVFLSAFTGCAMGICRCVQMSSRPLPHDAFDMPVNTVVTDA